ncbi:MAG: sulfatase-like hydrolase/transferase [bacterium]|nr:sulfatase-like hydrolase/transferase [bacterium]
MKDLNRRDFIKLIGAGTASLSLAGCTGTPGLFPREKPNILFIMTDDHASQAISSYGGMLSEYAKTPNIDRIAEEGVRFNNCFCTNSICAPSRATILTGKYSHLNGVLDNSLTFDGSQTTFPKLLQQAGYQTAFVGKWHLKSDPTGFDYWIRLPGQGDYYNPDLIEMGERKRYTGYVTDLVTDFSLDWLKNRDDNKPFCLMLHHKAPHRNWMPDEKHMTMFDDMEFPQPETFNDDYETRSDAAREQEMTVTGHMNYAWDLKVMGMSEGSEPDWGENSLNRLFERMTPDQLKAWNDVYGPKNREFKDANLQGSELENWKYQRYIKDYLRCIASVDDNIGRVLDHLDESGLAENTIVVYTSDQGFYLGEHGWFDKRFMYEESLRMPMVARYPGVIKERSVNNDIVLNVDFAPTFLALAGVPVPDDMQGESIESVLEDETPSDWRESMYYHYYEFPAVHQVKRHYGIRTKRHKLIHFYNDIDEWELYDLQEDPNEVNNVYNDDRYRSVVTELKQELERLRGKYGDSDELAETYRK